MEVGVAISLVHPDLWVDLARAADQHGYESVWLSEHLVFPEDLSSDYPGGQTPINPSTPLYDAPAYLCAMAAVTDRVLLGTNVYLAALRHPFVVARAFTTLDHLSGGRAVLGVGAGWLESEMRAVGIDPRTRGRRLDEHLEVVRRLWTEELVEHHGAFYDFEPVRFEPKPVRRPHPPILVGGSSPAALRRAARVGDGWISMPARPDEVPDLLARVRAACEEVGRDRPLEVTITDLEARTAEDVARWAETGIDRLVVKPWDRSRDALDGLATFAASALPAARPGRG